MTLRDLLSTLTTPNVTVNIHEMSTGAEIVSLKSTGFESLSSDIKESEVKHWELLTPVLSIKAIIDTTTTTNAEE